MAKTPERGLTIHFIDGTSLRVSFPLHEDNYKRKLMVDEMLKNRLLIVEADEGIHCMPFENIKYMSIFPATATEVTGVRVITGAHIDE